MALQQRARDLRGRPANLLVAVEVGQAPSAVFDAIRSREAKEAALDAELATLETPLDDRLRVMPSWVRQQIDDVAGLLAGAPERTKRELRRLTGRFALFPMTDQGARPFRRAEGSGAFEQLAVSRCRASYYRRIAPAIGTVKRARGRSPVAQRPRSDAPPPSGLSGGTGRAPAREGEGTVGPASRA
jgi:hypothetical protein